MVHRHLAWFEKPSEFREVKKLAEVEALLGHKKKKFTLLELFAGGCVSCKSVFPAMCKLASDDGMKADYDFLKVRACAPPPGLPLYEWMDDFW